MRARILVDVDGVCNAYARRVPGASYVVAQARGYPITYRPELGAELLRLAAEHEAELVWCTTWQDLAAEHIAPLLGLPEMPYIPLLPPKMSAGVAQTKAWSIRKWLGDTGAAVPFIWFEDEEDGNHWLREYLPGSACKMEYCHPASGITADELARADSWLRLNALSPRRAGITSRDDPSGVRAQLRAAGPD